MKRFSNEDKAMWLEDWQQSGMNAWAYATENGLVPQTFTRWTKSELKEQNKEKQAFIEVPKQLFQPVPGIQEILIEKGSLKIHIPLEPVLKELHTAIAKLGQAI